VQHKIDACPYGTGKNRATNVYTCVTSNDELGMVLDLVVAV
jgi:hypothetical protein